MSALHTKPARRPKKGRRVPEATTNLQSFFDLIPDLACVATSDCYFQKLNPAWEKLLGYTREELQAKPFLDLIHPDDRERTLAEVERQMQGRWTFNFVNRYRCKNGSYRWLEWTATPAINKTFLYATARDITERRQSERQQTMLIEVMHILNKPDSLPDAIAQILAAIQRATNFDAVGIRLQQSNDFPYYVHSGFTKDFLAAENTLAQYRENGDVCRNPDGSVRLECTCGLVLSGQTDPNHPLFTPHGSCWCNDTLPLLGLPADQDPRLHPRNRCIHAGFRAVALIPVRTGKKIIGLLQLNDRRANCFTLDMIRFFEGLSDSIGIALTRKQLEQKLKTAHDELEAKVAQRTAELKNKNRLLQLEMKERRRSEEALRQMDRALAEITDKEREKLRRDLHDSVCQQLTGIGFLAKQLARDLANARRPKASQAEELGEIARATAGMAHDIGYGLTPLSTRPGKLSPALRALASRVANVFGIGCRAILPKAIQKLDPLVANQLYLIAQEATNNAARHAAGTDIEITLSSQGKTIRLAVRDNGKGITKTSAGNSGMGMDIMFSRARLIGATLRVTPGKKCGTVVTCVYHQTHTTLQPNKCTN
ncbi:MAG: PAS domain S-box protein [Magnetococcus sp. WYHC-3]